MAGITSVQIARLAISHVAARTNIQSFGENKTAAFHCEMWYDVARGKTLEAFDWSFARHRKALTASTEDPPEGEWAFRYQYPASCLILRKIPMIGDKTKSMPFHVELDDAGAVRTILTDQEEASAVYTRDIEDPSLFTWHFVETMSYLLGHYISMPLTGKQQIRDTLYNLWRAGIRQATANSANEQMEDDPKDADWIAGRG
jgi:hypothetical protein